MHAPFIHIVGDCLSTCRCPRCQGYATWTTGTPTVGRNTEATSPFRSRPTTGPAPDYPVEPNRSVEIELDVRLVAVVVEINGHRVEIPRPGR